MSVATLVESNASAKRHFTTMTTNLDLVLEHLPKLAKIIAKMDKGTKGRGWHMSTPDELYGLVAKARKDIGAIIDQAKEYEAELVSRDWRV